MVLAEVGWVGKLPAHADFTRSHAHGPAFTALYGWLIEGVELAAASRAGWAARVPSEAVQAMCFHPPGAATLIAGAVAPSADAAGRRFPLAAGCELRIDAALAEHAEVLPLMLEGVWAQAGELVLELQQADQGTLAAAKPVVELDVTLPGAVASYRSWTEELGVDELVALVFDGDEARAAATLAVTDEAVSPYRGVESPDTPLSLRLPLGQAGGAAVCFWLDLVERLTGWRRTVPSFFWSHDGVSGALMLHLGRVPPAALPELWLPTGSCDEVCDLLLPEQVWSAPRLPRWHALIAEPGLNVSELLRAARASVAAGV